ncbi:hypothetical protein GCM10027169_08470 [Gordonia jinhuaensis]|uniref:N-acetyltransferase domain-containing protein n=1 Tax=Gordonia jinhuaensis TaxID=1517702 RepID=A0A916WYD0_9ACTN|nr:hypothetical protein GCM10011489_31980 [Gordonia jinhuaensis]
MPTRRKKPPQSADAILQQLSRVVHNPDRERFELWVAGDLVGVLGYSAAEDHGQRVLTILHTVLFDEYTGHGLASRLAGGAMQYAVDSGSRVHPICDFMQNYLQHNPVYGRLAV